MLVILTVGSPVLLLSVDEKIESYFQYSRWAAKTL